MPLTRRGISAQILSAIATYRQTGHCSINDCQVVVNHLVRKYSEPLKCDGLQRVFTSRKAAQSEQPIVREHLVPVKEIMRRLLELEDVAITEVNLDHVESVLQELLVVVRLTPEQDATLNAAGFQQRMPDGYFDSDDDLHRDPWARYRAAGIFNDIVRKE